MITSNLFHMLSRSALVLATALALMTSSMLPAHAATTAQGPGAFAQAGMNDVVKTNRVPGGCTRTRCR